jgi:hypothetical protein
MSVGFADPVDERTARTGKDDVGSRRGYSSWLQGVGSECEVGLLRYTW